MATAKKSAKTPTPAPQAAPPVLPPVTSGRFKFVVTDVSVMPDFKKIARPAFQLPFKELMVTLPHGKQFFIPDAYWSTPMDEGGRGYEGEVTSTYVRSKLRELFKRLQESPEYKDRLANKRLDLFPRKVGEPVSDDGKEKYEEPGFSVFVSDTEVENGKKPQ